MDIENELNLEIHIKVQQRNGRKCWTFVEGLDKITPPPNTDINKFMEQITRTFKKGFNCAATIQPGNIIQMSGDHRYKLKDYLINNKIVNEDQIKIHGY